MREVDQGLKTKFAKVLQICRTQLYRSATQQAKRDAADIETLVQAHNAEPFYGVARLAILLSWSERKTRRIRNLAGVTARRRKKKASSRLKPEILASSNLLKPYRRLRNPVHPEKGYTYDDMTDSKLKIWVQDFTYIWWRGRFYYLAATMQLATRQILGWNFGCYHTADLVYASLENALSTAASPPDIVHNDRGSEYMSKMHAKLCLENKIKMSASDPGSPTQNGFMESFFSSFKKELGSQFSKAQDLTELYEQIALWIYYYNHQRIHTALRMPPADYARTLQHAQQHATYFAPCGHKISCP